MIEEFTLGMDLEAFRQDAKTVAAVERKLLVISELAIRLGEQDPLLCPEIPWDKVRGTGNWLRHQYERINLETIWATVRSDLPSLKAAVVSTLASTKVEPKEPELK
jgi:uncharacterized protein with HEPN domain